MVKHGCIILMANSITTGVSKTAVVDGEVVWISVKRTDVTRGVAGSVVLSHRHVHCSAEPAEQKSSIWERFLRYLAVSDTLRLSLNFSIPGAVI